MKKLTFTLMIVTTLFLTGCGLMQKDAAYAEIPEGFKQIEALPGVTFALPDTIAFPTAVMSITPTSSFEEDVTYVYTDADKEFITFNMKNIVVMVQKGTAFHFDEAEKDEKESALTGASVLDNWFTKYGKKLKITESFDKKKDVYKAIMKVNAGVCITPRIFDDFVGELSVIRTGGTEYALFIGVPVSIYDRHNDAMKETFETVTKSFQADATNIPSPEEPPEVTVGEVKK